MCAQGVVEREVENVCGSNGVRLTGPEVGGKVNDFACSK